MISVLTTVGTTIQLVAGIQTREKTSAMLFAFGFNLFATLLMYVYVYALHKRGKSSAQFVW